jgi:lactate dehydrogenase-like 2-hydroxyacid dehydrogenase
MTHEILMTGPLPAPPVEELEKSYKIHRLWQAKDPEAMLAALRENVTAVMSSAFSGVSAEFMDALPRLKIISHFGVGYDNVDVQAAKERGIIVTNTPGVLTDDTADMAVALLLAALRGVAAGDAYVRGGQWGRDGVGPLPLGRSLRGRTAGIIGMGRIGQAIAARLGVFGVQVVYHGPREKKDLPYRYFPDLGAMAQAADILVAACLYSPQTHHLVTAQVLEALGKDGMLVNIARGKIVDEAALVAALENGVIAGAGLDVFAEEPAVPAALCRMDQVVLQPHRGSATRETRLAMAQLVVDNLRLYFEKEDVLTPV